MTGESIPFSADLVKKDSEWQALVTPSHYDSISGTLLLSLFKAFGLLLDRVLMDNSSTIVDADEKVRAESRTATTTNTVSERDFAKFDRLLRQKPNASTLALEAHILFTNNKTSEWFRSKSEAEKVKIMEEARKNAPKYRKHYHQRISAIAEGREKQQLQKQREKEEAERKQLVMNEKITSDIISYGLWQSEEQANAILTTLQSETQKRVALKAQLRFRKVVL